VAECEALSHLHRFVADLAGWLEHRLAEHRGDRDALVRAAEAEAQRLADLDRTRERLLDEWRKLADEGASVARYALEVIERVDTERGAQKQRVDDAEARVAEWTAEVAADSILDAYVEMQDFVLGRLSKSTTTEDVRAALGDLGGSALRPKLRLTQTAAFARLASQPGVAGFGLAYRWAGMARLRPVSRRSAEGLFRALQKRHYVNQS
jgi:hypothetical protein